MIIINIQLKINKLRDLMEEKGIDAYIIPSSDSHQSEYVTDHDAARAFITGFTGSVGTAVFTLKEAGLWTDGRYFVQAENQLENTGITLFKMGEKDVPSIEEFLKKSLKNGSRIGFNGEVISVNFFRKLQNELSNKDLSYEINEDLIAKIWDDRPIVPSTSIVSHDIKYAGQSREEKIDEVLNKMRLLETTHYVISGLDDIAWLLNIRGRDISFNPLTLAYFILSENSNILFIDERKLSDKIQNELRKANIEILPYHSIKSYLEQLHEGIVLLDSSKMSIKLHQAIKVKTIETMDITTKLKATKNDIQIENLRHAMVRDGVAMVKFIKWIKSTVQKQQITEIEAAKKLESLRKEDELFYDLSFSTISAYTSNAAMPHYRPTLENQKIINPISLYLIDSGAQYLDGTTDITRTIAMGQITDEEKTDFTLVLKGMIDLTIQRFIYGTTGSNLDIIARIPLWNAGLDYKHGTGHGVGFFLNVHEGPHKIDIVPNTVKLEKGMVMSNEPGVYKPLKHGIRIENLVVVQEDEKTPYGGQFMKFETLTLCPIDLEAIDIQLLSPIEKAWLNQYHETVYNKLSPYVNGDDLEYLREATRKI